MSASSPLIVELRDLPVTRRLALGADFVGAAIHGHPMREALDPPESDADAGTLEGNLELYAGHPGVFVRGELRGWLAVACSRCVERVEVPLEDRVEVTYLPSDQVPDPDQADDVDDAAADDVDLYPYEGEKIDLTTLLRERLIMAVPFAPLCAEDCKGLCSVCGANLNAGECGCDREVGDPRLMALKDLKA